MRPRKRDGCVEKVKEKIKRTGRERKGRKDGCLEVRKLSRKWKGERVKGKGGKNWKEAKEKNY